MENENNTCNDKAAYRYTWAGQNEAFICEKHSHKLTAVAQAIGYYIQLIPIDDDLIKCTQKI